MPLSLTSQLYSRFKFKIEDINETIMPLGTITQFFLNDNCAPTMLPNISLIGAMQYLSLTQSDIFYVVNKFAQYINLAI